MKIKHTLMVIFAFCIYSEAMACVCSSYLLSEENIAQYEFIALVKTDSIYASDQKKISERDLFFEVSFDIKKLYKGTSRNSMMIRGAHPEIHRWWTSCDMGIKANETWVLMAYRDNFGRLITGYCNYNIRENKIKGVTNPKSHSFQETVAFLDSHFGIEIEKKVLDGLVKTYYPNDSLKSEEYYRNGHLEGKRKTYYENGAIQVSQSYKLGMLHGQQLFYAQKGHLYWKYNFRNGHPVDTCYVYSSVGTLSNTRVYSKKGQLLSDYDYHSKNYLKSKLTYDSLTGHYTKTTYYESGAIRDHHVFLEHGHDIEFKRYYENGNLKNEFIYFLNDSTIRHIKKSWNKKGELIEEKVFKRKEKGNGLFDKNKNLPGH